jgi:putative ABC transport system substrate-binding protein
LELLKEMIPTARKMAGLWNGRDPGMQAEFGDTLVAAQALGLTLQSLSIRGIEEFEQAFALAGQSGTEALAVIADTLFFRNRSRIVELCAKSRLPAMSSDADFSKEGGLAAYGVSLADLWRRSATYVDKILKGTKPADLPIERPTTFDFVINAKTAQVLGLSIPASVLQQATEVIQ